MSLDENNNFTLTDEQVENWRKMLIAMPLPPYGLSLGLVANLLTRQQIVDIVAKLKPMFERDLQGEFTKITGPQIERPTNIIRTRPRNENKPVRG